MCEWRFLSVSVRACAHAAASVPNTGLCVECNECLCVGYNHIVCNYECVSCPSSALPSRELWVTQGTAGSYVYLWDKWYYATLRELQRGCPLESPGSAISHSYFVHLLSPSICAHPLVWNGCKWILDHIPSLWAYDFRFLTERGGEGEGN